MAIQETIFQNFIFKEFILPFLLVFFIVFAVLEKTKIFGSDKKQLNAITSFVIGLILVGVAYPKQVIGNMILFLTVALVITFVVLVLWGLVMGEEGRVPKDAEKWLKWVIGIVIVLAVAVAVIWATGVDFKIFNFFFSQGWSKTFWTNVIFIIIIAAAIALVIRKEKKD